MKYLERKYFLLPKGVGDFFYLPQIWPQMVGNLSVSVCCLEQIPTYIPWWVGRGEGREFTLSGALELSVSSDKVQSLGLEKKDLKEPTAVFGKERTIPADDVCLLVEDVFSLIS